MAMRVYSVAENSRSGMAGPDQEMDDVMPDRSSPVSAKANAVSLPSVTVRDYFPETWLWDLIITE